MRHVSSLPKAIWMFHNAPWKDFCERMKQAFNFLAKIHNTISWRKKRHYTPKPHPNCDAGCQVSTLHRLNLPTCFTAYKHVNSLIDLAICLDHLILNCLPPCSESAFPSPHRGHATGARVTQQSREGEMAQRVSLVILWPA